MTAHDDSAPTLYLFCGLPGAGKTTRARQITKVTPAIQLCADEWVVGLGRSLVDYEFRGRLQDCLLAHATQLLSRGVDVVLEFGSWHRAEREVIRQTEIDAGALVELHFVEAPIEELAQRVRARGGDEAEALTSVLLADWQKFEVPSDEEKAGFDRYVGSGDEW
jgi:predicted kinase